MTTMNLYFFGGCSVWVGFAIRMRKRQTKSEYRSRKQLARLYCWRVLSDQVRVNNIIIAIVGSTGIAFFWVANDGPILAAYAYQYRLPSIANGMASRIFIREIGYVCVTENRTLKRKTLQYLKKHRQTLSKFIAFWTQPEIPVLPRFSTRSEIHC